MQTPTTPAAPQRKLSLVDTTSIIIGIIIGSGLYETVPTIAAHVPGPVWLIGLWIVGGMFALVGSLCYAELATAYPADGGDYVYLTRAFGRPVGFLFAWAQLWVIRPGSIGMMAYVFGRYATELAPLGRQSFAIYAAASVGLLTLINVLGVRAGKWTQNLLTGAKLIGLAALVAIGLFFQAPPNEAAAMEPPALHLELALIFVVFTYGGWNDIAYVAAEVRDPQRNILRALLLGTGAVVAIYVGVNLAFLHGLSFDGVRNSKAVASDVAALAGGDVGRAGISLLVCISTLGAINGMILTGARIYYAMGRDHRSFALLGRWNARFGAPVWSLTIQAVCTLSAVLGFAALARDGTGATGFERLLAFTTPVFWSFLLATGVSLLVLRQRDPLAARPFRVPVYPLTPLVFCCGSALVVYSSLQYAISQRSWEALGGLVVMAVGIVLAIVLRDRTDPAEDA